MAKKPAELPKKRRKKWWYSLVAMLIPVALFLGMDYATSGTLSWSLWVAGIMAFFGVAYALLNKYGRE